PSPVVTGEGSLTQPSLDSTPPSLRGKGAGGLGRPGGEGPLHQALLSLDLARTTPLDALNLLARLQEEARTLVLDRSEGPVLEHREGEEASSPPLRIVREPPADRYAP
ncbi:MAG: hypothetical protein ACRDJE_24950, partial [Dehalococcoidia bacterium]